MQSLLVQISTEAISRDVALIGVLLLGLVLFCGLAFAVGWWFHTRKDSMSPYTGNPLRRGEYLSFYAKEQILRFVYEHHSYDNPMFKINQAALCRETGRLFPKALTWYGILYVDWNFIQKRRRGHYVSWGSLTYEQQLNLRRLHGSLKGYQTEMSSSRPSPRELEPKYVFIKPGPLYVDIDTHTVVGWKCVPGTDYEVLIVQRPPTLILPESVAQQNPPSPEV